MQLFFYLDAYRRCKFGHTPGCNDHKQSVHGTALGHMANVCTCISDALFFLNDGVQSVPPYRAAMRFHLSRHGRSARISSRGRVLITSRAVSRKHGTHEIEGRRARTISVTISLTVFAPAFQWPTANVEGARGLAALLHRVQQNGARGVGARPMCVFTCRRHG